MAKIKGDMEAEQEVLRLVAERQDALAGTFVPLGVTMARNFLGRKLRFRILLAEHLPPAQAEKLREFLPDKRLKKVYGCCLLEKYPVLDFSQELG